MLDQRRSVSGVDFARQLAEHRAQGGGRQAPTKKKLRSSAAPKGSKLPVGYRDRTHDRGGKDDSSKDEGNDAETRINALEEMVKTGQMERDALDKIRREMVGGDIGTTHLVKGLDYRLLDRVRRGEDVLLLHQEGEQGRFVSGDEKLDAEFEQLEKKEVVVVPVVDQGDEKDSDGDEMPPRPPRPPPTLPVTIATSDKKRSRDGILAELKASRKANPLAIASTPPPPQSILGPKFRKVGEKSEKTRIEWDGRGREVLITTNDDGRVKRKVRKIAARQDGSDGSVIKAKAAVAGTNNSLPMPDKAAIPLGMDVPESMVALHRPEEGNDDTENIFEHAGSDYDPLGVGGAEPASDSDEDEDKMTTKSSPRKDGPEPDSASSSPLRDASNDERHDSADPTRDTESSLPALTQPKARNYFGASKEDEDDDNMAITATTSQSTRFNPLDDPALLAALRKASKLDGHLTLSAATDGGDEKDEKAAAARLARHREMLSSVDRDADDLDMGFGGSRFDDVDDMDLDAAANRVKLSVWKGVDGRGNATAGGNYDDDHDHADADVNKNRQWGPKSKKTQEKKKKKNGDSNNAVDVLRVVEARNKKKKEKEEN